MTKKKKKKNSGTFLSRAADAQADAVCCLHLTEYNNKLHLTAVLCRKLSPSW